MADATRELMIMSVHPRHLHKIITGIKTVELRKTRPSVGGGQPVALYATSPTRAVLATCTISRVVAGAPHDLKNDLLGAAQVTSTEYDKYFAGADRAVGLYLQTVLMLPEPITLDHIRLTNTWHPPQTWHFVAAERLSNFVGNHQSLASIGALL